MSASPGLGTAGPVSQPPIDCQRPCAPPGVGHGKVEVHRVSYDYHKTQAKILAAGLHPALADRLGRGK